MYLLYIYICINLGSVGITALKIVRWFFFNNNKLFNRMGTKHEITFILLLLAGLWTPDLPDSRRVLFSWATSCLINTTSWLWE